MKLILKIISFLAFWGALYWIYKEHSNTEAYITALSALAAFIAAFIGRKSNRVSEDVVVYLIKTGHLEHRMIIENRGDDSVFDINLNLNLIENQTDPFPQNVMEKTFPINEIYPNDYREVIVALTFGTGIEFDGKWTWKNRKGKIFERHNTITIKT